MDSALKQLFVDLEALLKEYELRFKKIRNEIEQADTSWTGRGRGQPADIDFSDILNNVRDLTEQEKLDLLELIVTRLQIDLIDKNSRRW